MMDYLKPPTDNLYKFQAISGLLLVLVSVSYPPWLFHKAILGYHAAEKETAQLQVHATSTKDRLLTVQRRIDSLLDNPDTLKKEIDNLENQRQAQTSDSERTKISSEIDRLRARWQEAMRNREALVDAKHELSLSLQLKMDQMQHQQKISAAEMSMVRSVVFCAILALVVGILLTRRGFLNWHRRVQVFQDEALKKESENRSARTQNASDND